MAKELKDMSFDDIVEEVVHYELDAIIKGVPLGARAAQVTVLVSNWIYAINKAKSK